MNNPTNRSTRYRLIRDGYEGGEEMQYHSETNAYRMRERERRGLEPDHYRGQNPMWNTEERQRRASGVEPGRAEPNPRSAYRMEYDGDGNSRRMIGFGNAEMHYDSPHHSDEMTNRSGHKESGHSSSTVIPPLTREKAEDWVDCMLHADGSGEGERWSFEKTNKLLKERGNRFNPVDWYAIMNAMYADYCGVAMRFGIGGNIEFYAALAEAWLDDEDAVEDKAAAYYHCIARK